MPPAETPHQDALIDTAQNIEELESLLGDLVGDSLTGRGDTELFLQLNELLIEHLAAKRLLTRLLSRPCCCQTTTGTEPKDTERKDSETGSSVDEPAEPETIVHAALSDFRDVRNPGAVASGDLVIALRQPSGSFADLIQARLAQFMAPFEI